MNKMIFSKELEQKIRAKELLWDTEYFGVRSARVELLEFINESEQDEIVSWCKQYDFVTIMNKGNLPQNNVWIGKKTNAFLTDLNVQFIKNTEQESNQLKESYKISHGEKERESLLKIAQTAFLFSRFYNDPFLDIAKARLIYTNWVISAISDPLKKFVIAEEEGKVVGFLLFSSNDETTSIELIAVSDENQKHGVGRKMINTLQVEVLAHHPKTLTVGTQVDNKRAIEFYLRNGFVLSCCNSVFHLWSSK